MFTINIIMTFHIVIQLMPYLEGINTTLFFKSIVIKIFISFYVILLLMINIPLINKR